MEEKAKIVHLIADALKELLQLVPDTDAEEGPSEKCSCEFMLECIRQEGIHKKKKNRLSFQEFDLY